MESIYTLIQRAQNGDNKAKEQILLENNGLIWSVVKRFRGRTEPEDLYQIGAIGLLKCIDKFDISYEVKFSTYAVPMIMGEIRRFLRDYGTIKVSRSLKELAYHAKKIQDNVLKQENRDISIKELSVELDVTMEELILAMEAARDVQSIDVSEDYNSENKTQRIHQIYDGSENEKIFERIALKEALERLNTKERQIIFMRYFQDKTQSDVARCIGISQVQVSRIEKRILQQMKISLK